MRNVFIRSALALAVVGLVSSAPMAAQERPSQPGQVEKAKEPLPVTGELIALDDQARSLSIRTDAGVEMKFAYTEKTEIVGADKGVSGLSTLNGPRLTVHYGSHGTAHTATRIEVMPKK